MEQSTRFVGMNVHRDTIVVAVTATGEAGKATAYGTFPNTTAALEKLVKRLRQAGSGPLKFCYEAGPCGYGVHRTLTKMDEDCMVVAPSMIPRKSGDRQKNDKRDAVSLAVLHRMGLLTAVWVPDAAHEAMRDLIRTRLAAVRAVRTAQIVLEESIETVRLGEHRLDRVDGYLRAQIPTWSLFIGAEPVCAAWSGHDRQRRSGGGPWRSVTLCHRTRLHGLYRPGAVRAFFWTKAAHRCHHQGRAIFMPAPLLIEAAHSYRFPARISRHKLAAVDAVPEAVREIAWKAQTRLCQRYRHRIAKGKLRQVVVTAIARELAGFV